MKKKYLLESLVFAVAMMLQLNAHAQSYDFSAVAPSGQTLYYAIYDESSVLVVGQTDVELGDNYSPAYSVSQMAGNLIIPSTVSYSGNTYTVIAIWTRAFSNCTGLTSVSIPSSIRLIGPYAFYSCDGLSGTLTIPANETYYMGIYKGAFASCMGLTSLVISEDAYCTIEENAFQYCTNLASVTIPASVTQIGNGAFYYCNQLNAVYYTGSLEQWCGITFADRWANPLYYANNLYINNTLLTDLVIPNSVTQIGDYIFAGAECLTSLTIHNAVTVIDTGAFYECSGLTSLSIPNSVTAIRQSAFYGCTGLCYVSVPSSVTSVGSNAFYGVGFVHYEDEEFEDVGYYEDYLIYEDSATLIGCCKSAEGEIVIPSTVRWIGQRCFKNCSGITSVIIPNSVRYINEETFSGCTNLTSVTIGSSVSNIKEEAFWGCSNLAEIHSLNPVAPTLGTDVFVNVSSSIPVYIPCGSSMVYYGRWQYFYNYIEDCNGIDDVNMDGVKVYVRGGEIVVEGCNGEDVKVFDMKGREVYCGHAEGAIHVSDLGVYMVKVGDRPAHKVVVM